jgi:alkanesulfonate monooxygenase SsuD/methylene tetrahydromethanopterin reductase-like flavin-dependent oxidoreductase (luciferase family)
MSAHRLQFGLVLANRGMVLGMTSVQALLTLARQAKPRLDAIVLLSALAVQTHRVKLGPASFTSTPLRHALQLALQWCSLDVLSQGRMIFNASQGLQARQGEHLLRNMPLFRSNRLRVCAVWRRRLRSCAWPRLGSA